MKRISLVLAVMFLVFDYSWAEKKDAVKLKGNHANSFLLYKRISCSNVQRTAESWREKNYPLSASVNVHEECCDEGCDTEEMNENRYGSESKELTYAAAENDRENYMKTCC